MSTIRKSLHWRTFPLKVIFNLQFEDGTKVNVHGDMKILWYTNKPSNPEIHHYHWNMKFMIQWNITKPDFINKNMLHQWYVYIYTTLFLNICNSSPSAPFFRTIAGYTLKNWQWTNLAELDTLYFLQHHSHSGKANKQWESKRSSGNLSKTKNCLQIDNAVLTNCNNVNERRRSNLVTYPISHCLQK